MSEDSNTYKYDVETASLMSTIINSVYSSKDYAFRELISNASDACDKLNFSFNEFPNVAHPNELRITIQSRDGYVIIEDNGIGMTKADLVNCIGTIASSGTKKFKEALKEKELEGAKFGGIGQFGLGFYSAFLISDHVKVITRHPSDKTYTWESKGLNEYSINEAEEERDHGTQIILKVKSGDDKYAEISKIEELVKKYSSFIPYPIYLVKEVEEEIKEEEKVEEIKEEKVEEIKDEEEIKEDNETENDLKVEEVEEVKEVKEVKKQMVSKPVLVNKQRPLWLKKPKECTVDEYTEFYKAISNDWETFLASKHITLEGLVNLTFLLFIPKRSRTNMFEKGKKDNIKLYVQNVFVTDDFKDALPDWMSFISGVISSDDAPMNISRETFQGSNTMKMVKKNLSKKVIEMFEELSGDKEKYDAFLKEFGVNLKMAVRESSGTQQEKVAKLLRFYTTKSGSDMISLDEYICKNGDKNVIYVITGLSKDEVTGSPFLKLYQDSEVIYMYEPVDEIMLQGFNKFNGWDIKRITTEGATEQGKVTEEVETDYTEFIKEYKDVLSAHVERIALRDIGDAPCFIATTAYSHSAAMENIIRSQPGAESNPFLSMMGRSKKVFEINPNHAIIRNIKRLRDEKQMLWKKYGVLLFDTALIECGYKVESNVNYARDVYSFLDEHVADKKETVEETNYDEPL